MHDYEEVDPFKEFDGCADDIDVPELSEATIAELRRDDGVSDDLLQRIFDDVLGSAETSTPPDRADHAGSEGASAPSPLRGPWVYNPTQLMVDLRDRWSNEAAEAVPDHGIDAVSFDREQMTTIIVQVKHAPLTRDALALGAASALTARIDSMPIVDAVRRALESLYGSIGDPLPPPPSCSMANHRWLLPTAGDRFTKPGGEHSEAPSCSALSNPPGAPNTAPTSDDAPTSTDLFTYYPKEIPNPDGSTPKHLPPLGALVWTYPVTDVDVVVSLQQEPEPRLPKLDPESEPDPDMDDASVEDVDQLRRPIRELARAVNGFARTHRATTGNTIYAGDPSAGDEPVVVLTGELRPS
ncbi:hypothetical protein K3N28_06105 [Glycomyces sp. TRM65418]|uniref:hypothetical protein n=1 Tax=Glycomyces sp. TRM65418 TaxID=2867006 RepID=UPI001CE6EEDE|nr:hypothetical protein [Glycomyces sp. TRM65418]MCC3762642.1 hypothetical protein [Glycomyces sp. TRM65418]QZD56679.1 hypothetical protein K3N28_06065 [Glycomyces sp. TRM65418]